MANWRDIRPGRQFVSLTYLGNKTIKDTIIDIKPADYKGKAQLVGTLKKLDMAINLNATSCKLFAEKYGDDYEKWSNHSVTIQKKKVPFGPGEMDAIVVKPDGK